jgi:hypothetical protein
MRKVLVAFGILVLLLVGADFGLRALGQYWVSGQLQDSFELDQRPSVSLGGFPFLPRLVTGRFPLVSVQAEGTLRTGRFPLSAVDLALQDVRFPPDQLLFGNKATIRAESGSGSAILTEQQINRAFPATVPITIRLSDGRVHIRPSGQQTEVETRLRIVDNQLVLLPAEGPLPVEVRVGLPVFVSGLTYTGVKVEGSRARLFFRLTTPSVQVK